VQWSGRCGWLVRLSRVDSDHAELPIPVELPVAVIEHPDRIVTPWSRRRGLSPSKGNALIPAFMADYNVRFAKLPANAKNLHPPPRALVTIWRMRLPGRRSAPCPRG
jgi:hypothetical protein